MKTRGSFAITLTLAVGCFFVPVLVGCSDPTEPLTPVAPTTAPSPTSPPSGIAAPSISSISPTSAMTGSSDLTMRLIGTNFIQPQGPVGSWVIWTRSDPHGGTALRTTFVSTTELTAVVPAALLNQPGTALVFVENGDIMGISDGFHGYPMSNAVDFNVIPAAPTPPQGETWNGNVTVQSLIGPAPCLPSFWREGSGQPVSVIFMAERGWNGSPLLYVAQPVSGEACRLRYLDNGLVIDAVGYYSDPMADASDCHMSVRAEGCRQISLGDVQLKGTFTDVTRTRLSGTLNMFYEVWSDSEQRWVSVTILKRLDIVKGSP